MAQQTVFRLRIRHPGETPQVWNLPPGETSIGRAADNTLVLGDDRVSKYHARIECTPAGTCLIVDQRSTNGTLVNGKKLVPGEPTPLVAGAVVAIDPFELTVEEVPPPPAPVPAPAVENILTALEQPPKPPAAAEPVPAPERKAAPPPPPPPPPPPSAEPTSQDSEGGVERLLPGLTLHSQRLLQYLPDIYQPPRDDGDATGQSYTDTDFSSKRFMSRLLGLFESILLPIEWTVDNFDLFLDPRTSPSGFLNWLANWFEITFDATWTEQQQRKLLREAHEIYAWRGTRRALSRMLEIYIGQPPVIVDDAKDQDPFTFDVILPVRDDPARRASIQSIIDAHKPAHTTYKLKFRPNTPA